MRLEVSRKYAIEDACVQSILDREQTEANWELPAWNGRKEGETKKEWREVEKK